MLHARQVENESGKSESQGFVLLSAQFGPKMEAPPRRANVEETRREPFQVGPSFLVRGSNDDDIRPD